VIVGVLRRIFGRRPATRGDALSSPKESGAPDHFAEIVRELSVGVMMFNGKGRLTWLNAAAEEIFDITRRPVLGRVMIEIVPSIELDRRIRAVLDGDAWRGSVELAVHGTLRSLTVSMRPFIDEPGVVLMVSDQTRLHELEQTRRDFVSNVAHELRTPLASVKLMVETIAEAPNDQDARDLFLPRIGAEVNRLVDLVEDLLDVARGESGQLVLFHERLDLLEIVASALKTFEPRARMQNVLLESAGQPAPVLGDAGRLTQVIVNLVDNALRHTPAGGAIHVRLEKVAHEAHLVVADTGIGIPYNDLPHIFERFYVVDRSRARESGGTGLGLSIVKQIVEAHGGTVGADSELGCGAVFTCAFPLLTDS
jgi:two-component system phosphate regulon sensor histidine kinase PhoR